MAEKKSSTTASKKAAPEDSPTELAPADNAASAAAPTKAAPGKSGTAKDAPAKKSATVIAAERLMDAEPADILDHGAKLSHESDSTATKSARILAELTVLKPEAVVPLVVTFVKSLPSSNKRVVQTAADALPAIVKVAPARVAKQLDKLKDMFGQVGPVAKDGIVRTLVALCAASVAYQRRAEPLFTRALKEAEPKVLIRWTEEILPTLKGEPHANCRAVVEERLATTPKATAQKLADFLGVNLRHHRLR
jgi:hypothetical protein